jgi:hypothetical protein
VDEAQCSLVERLALMVDRGGWGELVTWSLDIPYFTCTYFFT